MATDYTIFPEVFENEVVSYVRQDYDPTGLILPYLEVGTYLELTKENALKDRIAQSKYPLIWLIWGDGRNKEQWSNRGEYNVNVRGFIIARSNKDYKTEDRIENVFKPILNPIWQSLKNNMQESHFFEDESAVNFNKVDHFLWGVGYDSGKLKNMIGDWVDAIEFEWTNLKVLKTC